MTHSPPLPPLWAGRGARSVPAGGDGNFHPASLAANDLARIGIVKDESHISTDPGRRISGVDAAPSYGCHFHSGKWDYHLERKPTDLVRGNVDGDRQSLRGFLRMVEADYPDEILRIREPVDLRFDMTSLVFELERAGKSPVVVFENVEGTRMPVVTNIAGNRKLLAACLGVTPAELPTAFRERCQKYIPCEVVDEAPWQEVVLEGDEVDLTKLPIPLHFSVDAAPYITAGQITARDPVTGVDTTGFHRLMLKGKNRLGVSLHSRRRMCEFHRRAEERGQIAAGGDHARHPSAALHGLDGLRLSAARAEVRDHRRAVRRALSARHAAASRTSRCRPAPRSSSRARSSPT